MAFIALDEAVRFVCSHLGIALAPVFLYYLYPVKTVAVALLLLKFRHSYTELRWKDLADYRTSAVIVLVGVVTFVMWIYADWIPKAVGAPKGFDPSLFPDSQIRVVMILFRVAGAVLVVPLMEELFWRSFLLRYLVDKDYSAVAVGRFTWFSFLGAAVLFGLEHHLVIAGIVAGAIYSAVLYRTKSIAQCVLAHAVTNLALALYVLSTAKWYFW